MQEFFYPKQTLEKAQNRPLVQILESIEDFLATGVYTDKTGIAHFEDTANDIRFRSVGGNSGYAYPAEATTGGREDGERNYVIFKENHAQIGENTVNYTTEEQEIIDRAKAPITIDGERYICVVEVIWNNIENRLYTHEVTLQKISLVFVLILPKHKVQFQLLTMETLQMLLQNIVSASDTLYRSDDTLYRSAKTEQRIKSTAKWRR